MKRLSLLLLLLTAAALTGGRSAGVVAKNNNSGRPRLIVNIVVSGLRPTDLELYEEGFGKGGFRRLMEGTYYPYAYYPFTPNKPAALATLTTGALPSLHGVVGEGWWNYTTGDYASAVGDNAYSTFDTDAKDSRVANTNLILETLGDVVVGSIEGARSVSVATDAESAIILGGLHPSEVWWFDPLGGNWTTSTRYANSLPKWVRNFNRSAFWRSSYGAPWILSRGNDGYVHSKSSVAKPHGYKLSKEEKRHIYTAADVVALGHTHTINDVVAQFAKEAIIYNRLGFDASTDVLNVCFDSPLRIAQRYGLSSREVEDMYYRLDESIADLLTFASAQASGHLVVCLVGDGGCREVEPTASKVFNTAQARFLINSFLSATYGKDEWVLGYKNGGIWLNHTLIFSRGLELPVVQSQVAAFALQLRGVSHAITASDMMEGGVKEGLVEIAQRGFYPKRSADVTFVLMPDWCESGGEEETPTISQSLPYAPYRRTMIALCGEGVKSGERNASKVDVRSLVVTLSEIAGVDVPLGAEFEPLEGSRSDR